MTMWVLALDSATPRLGVALARLTWQEDGTSRLEELHLGQGDEGGGQHARRLPDLLLEVLADAERSVDEVEALIVGLGPGSFTGLRTGLATIKALAYGRRCPLVGVGSLPAYALDARRALDARGELLGPDARLVPCLDARRAEVYAGCFDRSGHGREPLATARAIAPDGLLEKLEAGPGETFLVFGPGGEAYPTLRSSPHWRGDLPTHPTGAGLIELAAPRLRDEAFDDPLTLLPVYARKAEAELKLASGELKIQGLTVPTAGTSRKREDLD